MKRYIKLVLLLIVILVSQGCMTVSTMAHEQISIQGMINCAMQDFTAYLGWAVIDATAGYYLTWDNEDRFRTNLGQGTLVSVGIIGVDLLLWHIIHSHDLGVHFRKAKDESR